MSAIDASVQLKMIGQVRSSAWPKGSARERALGREVVQVMPQERGDEMRQNSPRVGFDGSLLPHPSFQIQCSGGAWNLSMRFV